MLKLLLLGDGMKGSVLCDGHWLPLQPAAEVSSSRPPFLPSLQRQKNWMPLTLPRPGNEALFVTDIQPLTVVSADLKTGSCRLVRGVGTSAGDARNKIEEGSQSSTNRGGTRVDAGHLTGGAAGGDTASLAALLGGAHLHGGSPFVRVGPARYLR